MDENLKRYIELIPKAELHVHIEGTFEPGLIFEIAQRNNLALRYNSVEELREAVGNIDNSLSRLVAKEEIDEAMKLGAGFYDYRE